MDRLRDIFSIGTFKRLLWSNAGARQTIAKNTFWVGLSELSINLLKFALLVYATRTLGDVGFGQFAFVSSFVTIFGVLFDLGLSEAITREFAKEARNEAHIASLFSLKLVLSACASLVMILASFFVAQTGEQIQAGILIMSGYMFLGSLSGFFYAIFRARQKMQMEFFPNVLQNLSITGFGFLLLYLMPSVTSLTWAYCVGAGIAFVPVVWYFHRRVTPLRFVVDKATWKVFLRMSYPLALVGIVAGAIYNNADSIMLGLFGRVQENGWYSAAYRLVTFSLLPMVFISQSFFPALSAAAAQSKEKLARLSGAQSTVFLSIGLPIFIGGYLLAAPLIAFLYPPEFLPAAAVLKILFVTAFLVYLYMPFKQLLVVLDLQKKVFMVFLAGLSVNVVLNLFAIPLLGLYGAAVSTLAAQLFVFAGLMVLAVRNAGVRIMRPSTLRLSGVVLAASAMMSVVLQFLRDSVHVMWVILAGAATYVVAFSIIYFVIKLFRNKKHESQR